MKSYSLLMKFSLISISLFLLSASSVVAAIPLMAEQFSDVPLSLIEFLTMAPALAAMIAVALSVPIAAKIGDKACVIIGMILTLVGGVLPYFLNDFWLILGARIILGAGLGLFNQLAISMIQVFFKGEEATRLIGIRAGFEGLGGAILTLVVGFLLGFGWHAAFLVYALIIPFIILFALFVPRPPREKGARSKSVFNKKILPYVVIIFLILTMYNCLALKLPSLIVERGLGTAPTSSFIFSMAQLVFVFCGFIFARVFRLLKNNILPFGFALMAVGYLIIAFVDSNFWILIGSLMAGASFAFIGPWLFNQAGNIGDPASIPLSNTLLILGAQIAGLLSPFILLPLQLIPILSDPFEQCFLSCAIILIGLTIFGWFYARRIPVAK